MPAACLHCRPLLRLRFLQWSPRCLTQRHKPRLVSRNPRFRDFSAHPERPLPATIDRNNLTHVYLAFYKRNADPARRVVWCSGGHCPDFERCEEEHDQYAVKEAMEACWEPGMVDDDPSEPLPPLNCPDVAAPGEGAGAAAAAPPRHDGRCTHPQDFVRHEQYLSQISVRHHSLPPRARRLQELVNLAYWNGGQFYHGIVELLPTYLLLHGFLARKPDVPIVQRQMQIAFYDNTLQHFVGVPTSATNFKTIRNGELFFARRLVQPIFQWSARPSKAVWRVFRSESLVRRDGLPMFFANWNKRFPSAPLSPPAEWTEGLFDTEVQQPPPPPAPPPPPPPDDAETDDWVVIYVVRETTRMLTESEEVHAALKDAFSSERIVVFDGRLPVKDAKLLFNRARLVVGVHGPCSTMPTDNLIVVVCWQHCQDVVQVLNTVAPIVLRASGAS
eukprot:SM000261S09968  [mRNA]  locus=s261:107097:111725:+ [translate_table: standard]